MHEYSVPFSSINNPRHINPEFTMVVCLFLVPSADILSSPPSFSPFPPPSSIFLSFFFPPPSSLASSFLPFIPPSSSGVPRVLICFRKRQHSASLFRTISQEKHSLARLLQSQQKKAHSQISNNMARTWKQTWGRQWLWFRSLSGSRLCAAV